MIKCLYCNALFDSPLILREYHNELDENPFEEIPVCPYCLDTDIIRSDKND